MSIIWTWRRKNFLRLNAFKISGIENIVNINNYECAYLSLAFPSLQQLPRIQVFFTHHWFFYRHLFLFAIWAVKNLCVANLKVYQILWNLFWDYFVRDQKSLFLGNAWNYFLFVNYVNRVNYRLCKKFSVRIEF